MPLDAQKARRFRNGDAAVSIETVLASDVLPEPISWIWEGYLASGKLTLLGGLPDVGKTLVGTDMIARITNIDTRWPNGALAPTGGAIILSAEDAAEDTIRPRLEAAGALLESVCIIKAAVEITGRKRTFNLQRDLEALAQALKHSPKFLMIDPITAYLGDIDSHRTTDVRAALEPLSVFIGKHRLSTLAITHPPKAAHGNAINNFTGSLAFVAAPRLAFVAVKETSTNRKLLLPVKNNIGQMAQGRGYSISTKQITNSIIAPHIIWDDMPVDVTASEAMCEATRGEKTDKLEEAIGFLKAMLTKPRPKQEIEDAAKANDISPKTLRRARETLGVTTTRDGFPATTIWSLS